MAKRAGPKRASATGGNDVTVRMYRGILGDCFLLTVRAGDRTRRTLIDCGVLQNVAAGSEVIAKLKELGADTAALGATGAFESGPERIRRVVADLIKDTGGRLDLLVLTHEHFDHLSGLMHARELFESQDLTIDALWFAWTEDPEDETARRLRARLERARHAIAMAMSTKLAAGSARMAETTGSLLAFMGMERGADGAVKKESIRSTRDMIDFAKEKVGKARTRYLSPGDVLGADEAAGLKAYVLGPPRDEARLKKDSPSRKRAKEVYLTGFDELLAVESATAATTLLGSTQPTDAKVAEASPFARPHLRGPRPTETDDPRSALFKAYETEDHRKIDEEWLGSVEALALKMDSDTNNTSLALAFELPNGDVLLFPGDAQVGAWLSWSDQTYPAKPAAGERPATIDDLLARCVFYKVAHHGSHNATLKEQGLEKMTSDRLTAAIPVVEAVASIQGKGRETAGAGWKMPYGELYARLMEKSKKRVVRGDGDPGAETAAFTAAGGAARVSHAPDGLWVELTFPM